MSEKPPEPGKKRWVEPAVAVLMSLATLSTAWCSYESAAWTRQSGGLSGEAAGLEKRATVLELQGNQALIIHASMFMQLLAARQNGNSQLADFYAQRFPPDVKKAYEAWLAQKPFENPAADPHPFVPSLYEMRGTAEAAKARAEAAQRVLQGRVAGEVSGQYLANTVLFAAVLFFAGTAGRFEQQRVRLLTVILAVSLFGFTAARTLLLPIASAPAQKAAGAPGGQPIEAFPSASEHNSTNK